MFFNSLSYLLFLLLAVILYWLLPRKMRPYLLLWASILFYGFWKVEYLAVIIFSAFVDFFVSIRIHEAATLKKREIWLWISLSINLGLLLYFKYTYFIFENLNDLIILLGVNWQLAIWKITLPLGISFYTFVSLSYTIDIYRKKLEPIRDFSLYLTYVMFWPHMIAGPILRGHELIHQLKEGQSFLLENILQGIKLIISGLFLKVVLADQIAPLVDSAFTTNPAVLSGVDAWAMAFGFGLQIYFDFSGYSLIAIGSARLLGIHFPQNFNWPYLAVSPRDFWKRWHITLSAWIRDYLYLPLSGIYHKSQSGGGIDIDIEDKRASKLMLVVSLFITWFIMGLWHGANWKFAFWGLWHASIIFIYRLIKSRFNYVESTWTNLLGWAITLPLVMLAWIPFRAESLGQSFEILIKVINPRGYFHISFRENYYLLIFILMIGMLVGGLCQKSTNLFLKHPIVKNIFDIISIAIMIFFVFAFLKPINQFIYFQF